MRSLLRIGATGRKQAKNAAEPVPAPPSGKTAFTTDTFEYVPAGPDVALVRVAGRFADAPTAVELVDADGVRYSPLQASVDADGCWRGAFSVELDEVAEQGRAFSLALAGGATIGLGRPRQRALALRGRNSRGSRGDRSADGDRRRDLSAQIADARAERAELERRVQDLERRIEASKARSAARPGDQLEQLEQAARVREDAAARSWSSSGSRRRLSAA